MSAKLDKSKPFRVEVVSSKRVLLRTTGTVQHAIKHACLASELAIPARVIDARTGKLVLAVPPIDRYHRIKPSCKRDKRYMKLAMKGVALCSR